MCRTRKGEEGLNKRCTQSNLKKRYLECGEREEITRKQRGAKIDKSKKSNGQSPRKERQGSEHILRCIKDISRTGKRDK